MKSTQLTKLLAVSLTATIAASFLTGCSPELVQAFLASSQAANKGKPGDKDLAKDKGNEAQGKDEKDKAKDSQDSGKDKESKDTTSEKDKDKENKDSGSDKVTVCHQPGTPAEQSLDIDSSALEGHLGHGDYEGSCKSSGEPSPTPTATAPEPHPSESPLPSGEPPQGAPCAIAMVKVRWGQFEHNAKLAETPTKWSGVAKIDNGKVRLIKRVLFEPNDQVLPREAAHALLWQTVTTTHFDGLVFAFQAAPTGPVPNFKIDLNGHVLEGPIPRLAGLHEVKGPDQLGNRFEISASMLPPHPDQCKLYERFESLPPEPDETASPSPGPSPSQSASPSPQPSQSPPPCGRYVPKSDGSLDLSRPDGSPRNLKPGEYQLLNNNTQAKVLKAGEPDTGLIVTAPPCPGASPTPSPSPSQSASPSPQPSQSPPPCGRYVPKSDGSLDLSRPDGSPRNLKPGEYQLLNNNTQAKVLKAGEPDTGAVVTAPPCP